jgi:ribosomal protein S1
MTREPPDPVARARVAEAKANGEVLHGRVIKVVPGGLILDVHASTGRRWSAV